MLPADFVTFPQVSRIARAKATSLVRETRAKMGDLKGKVSHAIVRLRVLAYEKHAASPAARLAHQRKQTMEKTPRRRHAN